MTTLPKWYELAKKELGTREIAGDADNQRIVEYAACTTLHATDDETPWCSAFVNWCMKSAGEAGTGLANARSWLTWGIGLEEPREGCITILRRGAPLAGHVTFYVKEFDKNTIICIGGNQGDMVKYSHYPKSDVLGYRWPSAVK